MPVEISAKIKRVGERAFQIDRSIIDTVLERQAELVGTVRVVPRPGRGVAVFNVRSGTLLALLGIENGDLLESINGFSLATPEGALEAFARLRVASSLQLKVIRAGGPLSLDYELR